MLVTLSGMVTLVSPVQLLNALSPMPVTLSGMVMLVRFLQPENAELPMLVTLSGMTTFSSVSLHITIVEVTVFEPSAITSSFILQFLNAL